MAEEVHPCWFISSFGQPLTPSTIVFWRHWLGWLWGALCFGGAVLIWPANSQTWHWEICSLPLSYLCHGVLQESLLFIIYMKLLGEIIKGFGGKCHQYRWYLGLFLLNNCVGCIYGCLNSNWWMWGPSRSRQVCWSIIKLSKDWGIMLKP